MSKRIDYRQVVRKIYWRRVDSGFEADWIYYEAARQAFPQTYRGLMAFRPAWFVHVDPEARFPRYTRSTELSGPGTYFGPIQTREAAGKLVEMVEDSFDLCRYHNILTQSPHGKACAYKQMHKCAAPCDGSVSLESFRYLYEWSIRTLNDPTEMIADQKRRMQHAVSELKFEAAGKIKAFIDQLEKLRKGPYRHARRLNEFKFLSLQPGPWRGTVKIFLVTLGCIEEVAGLIAEPQNLPPALTLPRHAGGGNKACAPELIGLVSHHLYQPKQQQGLFLPLQELTEKTLLHGYRTLLNQKPAETTEEEGIVHELQGGS